MAKRMMDDEDMDEMMEHKGSALRRALGEVHRRVPKSVKKSKKRGKQKEKMFFAIAMPRAERGY